MNPRPERLAAVFRFLLARRFWIVAFYALLLPPSVYFATRLRQDNALERLVVEHDPDVAHYRDFRKVFGSGEYAVLLAEAPDPFSTDVLRVVDRLEKDLARIPGVETSSALSAFRRARGGFEPTEARAAEFREFAGGTEIFRRQGLVGGDFLAIPVVFTAPDAEARRGALAAVNRVTTALEADPFPLSALRKVGQPYVNAQLDEGTRLASLKYFPLFAAFVIVLNVVLYRSFRALAAFLVTLGVAMALTVGYVGLTGGVITLVSPLVPMTVLITCSATLVYIHSRYVEHVDDLPVEEHHVAALVNKFAACTASIFAAAVGFAALAVSKIRPIREMGIWVAVGLLITWVVVFTLFPALQRILRTPTQKERRIAAPWFIHFTRGLPVFCWRYRWIFVPLSLLLCAAGAVALFGVPGLLSPMKLETHALEYIDRKTDLYRDTKRLEQVVKGLSMTEVWIQGEVASLVDPAVLVGLEAFERSLSAEPGVGAAVGPATVLRLMRYVTGRGDAFPTDAAELESMAADVEQLLPTEPLLQRFVDRGLLSQTHVTVLSSTVDYDGFSRLEARLRGKWAEASSAHPALRPFQVRIVGLAPLQAKIAHHLVPTLAESFALTVVVLLVAFFIVFRNVPALVLAMIPSLFAILVMFGVMRLAGMSLNVATILIASTVLGASVNDQIHFFYHYLERRRGGTVGDGLRHTLFVAGRAIFFATLLNAGGFLAFALADLPPMRQFGILSALAFLLSMVADFTALPAAIWLVERRRPTQADLDAEPS